jgi:hypothetical protein
VEALLGQASQGHRAAASELRDLQRRLDQLRQELERQVGGEGGGVLPPDATAG